MPVSAALASNKQLSAVAVGDTVKINVGGTAREFIVVQHGKPSSLYDNSFNNGVWLLQSKLYDEGTYDSFNTYDFSNTFRNDYSNWMHTHLNTDYYNAIAVGIRNKIIQVKVPYRPGGGVSQTINSGANGLSAKIFSLSAYEVNTPSAFSSNGRSHTPVIDGTVLSYFVGAGDAQREAIATFGTGRYSWWLRTPDIMCANADGITYTCMHYIRYTGGINCGDGESKTRPSFVLPNTMYVDSSGFVVADTIPTVPSSISFTLPTPKNYGVAFNVTWGASTSSSNTLAGYRLERQINGGAWTQIYQGTATSFSQTLTRNQATTVNYRVKGYSTGGLESGYATSTQRSVVNNTAPPIPASITIPASIMHSTNFTVSWAAVTDPDSDAVTYILEEQLSGGSWVQRYSGTATSTTRSVVRDTTNVNYRVKTQDNSGLSLGTYRTGTAVTVTNNRVPTNPPSWSAYPSTAVNQWSTATLTWTCNASTDADNDAITYYFERSINGGAYTAVQNGTSRTYTYTPVSGNTSVAVRVRAYDTRAYSGYLTSSTTSVTWDTTAPTVPSVVLSGTSGANGWYTSNVTATITHGTDSQSGVTRSEYSTNGGASYVTGTSVTLTANTAFRARTIDNKGNTSSAYSVQVNIDKVKPNVPTYTVSDGKTVGDGKWNNSDITLTLINPANTTVSGLEGVLYSLDGGAWVKSTNVTVTKTTSIRLKTRSNAGLESDIVSVQVNIDRVKSSAGFSRY